MEWLCCVLRRPRCSSPGKSSAAESDHAARSDRSGFRCCGAHLPGAEPPWAKPLGSKLRGAELKSHDRSGAELSGPGSPRGISAPGGRQRLSTGAWHRVVAREGLSSLRSSRQSGCRSGLSPVWGPPAGLSLHPPPAVQAPSGGPSAGWGEFFLKFHQIVRQECHNRGARG